MTGATGVTSVKERAPQGCLARADDRRRHDDGKGGAIDGFPHHFGAQLVAARQRSGQPRWMIASRSDGILTLRDLREAEAGQLPLDEATTARLAHLYGLDLRDALPSIRPDLTIGTRSLCVAGVTAEFEPDNARSLLSAYLEAVRALRSIDDVAPIEVRQTDLREMIRTLGGSDRSTLVLANVLAMATAEGRVVVSGLMAGATAVARAQPSGAKTACAASDAVMETTADLVTSLAS